MGTDATVGSLRPLPTHGRIDALETLGQRLSFAGFTQSQNLASAQKRLDCSAQASPELDLAGDGSLCDFRSKTRVKNEGIGKLNRLTHNRKVALCYR